MWQLTPVIPAPAELKQKDHKLKLSLGYRVSDSRKYTYIYIYNLYYVIPFPKISITDEKITVYFKGTLRRANGTLANCGTTSKCKKLL